MKAYITVGCSASGKSKWANDMCISNPNCRIIERDFIRKGIIVSKNLNYKVFEDNMWKFWDFKWENEVTEIQRGKIEDAANRAKDVIISDTNLNIGRRNEMKSYLESLGFEVEIKVFGQDTSMEALWKRDNFRVDSVGFQTIAKQYQQFRQEFPRYIINKNVADLPKVVLVDIDGTMTMGAHNRSPFEWDKVSQDLPNDVVVSSIRGLHREGYKIIFMSGRDSVCREDTIKWLDKYLLSESIPRYSDEPLKYDLFMRAEGDMRKDYIIKSELYFEHIDGKYQVAAVFDDRMQVRLLWHDMGFNVIAVGNPYISF